MFQVLIELKLSLQAMFFILQSVKTLKSIFFISWFHRVRYKELRIVSTGDRKYYGTCENFQSLELVKISFFYIFGFSKHNEKTGRIC